MTILCNAPEQPAENRHETSTAIIKMPEHCSSRARLSNCRSDLDYLLIIVFYRSHQFKIVACWPRFLIALFP